MSGNSILIAAALTGNAVVAPTTYQLLIRVPCGVQLQVGRLGCFDFPPGIYCYTGSAKRNFEARVARHLCREKKRRWHIDYLLLAPGVVVTEVLRSHAPECALNQQVPGRVVVPGFGASDCRAGCGSHLKWLAPIEEGRDDS